MYDVFPVCAFPYILAFTQDTMEIRLIINGNLVHTMSMPDLSLITAKVRFYTWENSNIYVHMLGNWFSSVM